MSFHLPERFAFHFTEFVISLDKNVWRHKHWPIEEYVVITRFTQSSYLIRMRLIFCSSLFQLPPRSTAAVSSCTRIQRQGVARTLIVPATNQRRCMINAICCVYSKLPPDDEQLICSKHVEDDY
jgi:hypothetical protein